MLIEELARPFTSSGVASARLTSGLFGFVTSRFPQALPNSSAADPARTPMRREIVMG